MCASTIVLHVTSRIFKLISTGVKRSEYRPQTRYYMARLEKARDYLALKERTLTGYVNPPLFVDIRKAYLPKESHDSWYIARVRGISLVKVDDIPEDDRKLVIACYKDKFKSGFFKDLLFYRIDLE